MQLSAVIHDSLAQRNNFVYIHEMIHGSGSGSNKAASKDFPSPSDVFMIFLLHPYIFFACLTGLVYRALLEQLLSELLADVLLDNQ